MNQKPILNKQCEMKQKPLFSFVVLAYNNYCYITETLDSLFAQTYPNIELLVSNDAALDFDEEGLNTYIEQHKGVNITRVVINNSHENIGTVKSVELMRTKATGQYIMYMAADDALYDETVLERYADRFERLGQDALILSSKTAMCGHQLEDVRDYAPDIRGINAIKQMNSEQLFSYLSHTFTIPTTSTAYRMSLYEKIGGYDTDYYIIEDAPLYIRMAREGIRFHWIDNMIGARHRDGGISHGNTLNLSESYRRYRYDEITFYNKEIVPYKDRILPEDHKKAEEKYAYIQRNYFNTFVYPKMTTGEKLCHKGKHLPVILLHMAQRFIVQVVALSLNDNIAKTIQYIAAVSMVMAGGLLIVGQFYDFGLLGSVALLVRIGMGAGFTLIGMQACKLLSILIKSIKFILIGK